MSDPNETWKEQGKWKEGLEKIQSLLVACRSALDDDDGDTNMNEMYAELVECTATVLENNPPSASTAQTEGEGAEDEDFMPEDIREALISVKLRGMINGGLYDKAVEEIHNMQRKQNEGKGAAKRRAKKQQQTPQKKHVYAAEEAYALYRKKKFAACRDVCEAALLASSSSSSFSLPQFSLEQLLESGSVGKKENDNTENEADNADRSKNLGLLHTYGQCLYRLNDSKVALEKVYGPLLLQARSGESELDEEALINLLATTVSYDQHRASTSKGTSASSNGDKALESSSLSPWDMIQLLRALDEQSRWCEKKVSEDEDEGEEANDDDIDNYDLLYNAGTAMALHATSLRDAERGISLLKRAETACQKLYEVEDGDADAADEELQKSELTPIHCNLALANLLLADATKIPPSLASASKSGSIDTAKLAEAMFAKVLGTVGGPAVIAKAHDGGGEEAKSWKAAAAAVALNNIAVIKASSEAAAAGDTAKLEEALKRLPDVYPPASGSKETGASKKQSRQRKQQQQQQHFLSAMQMERILLNKAILLLRLGKGDECRLLLDHVRQGDVHSRPSQGGGGSSASVRRNVCADLIEVSLLRREGKPEEGRKSLENVKATFAQDGNNSSKYFMAECRLFEAQQQLLDKEDKAVDTTEGVVAILDSLDDDKKFSRSPAVTATLVDMYKSLVVSSSTDGEKEQYTTAATNLLASSAVSTTPALVGRTQRFRVRKAQADFQLRHGLHQEAVKIYEEILDEYAEDFGEEEKNEIVAALVSALSYFDVERAEELMATLALSEEEEEEAITAEGEELETRQLPRSQRVARRRIAAKDEKKTASSSTSKNREKRLRQRAKKREVYLKKLEAEGKYNPLKPKQPDPERWIPKKQRSYNKRGRGRNNKFVGAQGAGAGTEKDAAQLDAAARAAERKQRLEQGDSAMFSKRSTAHINVSSGSGPQRRGGRRR